MVLLVMPFSIQQRTYFTSFRDLFQFARSLCAVLLRSRDTKAIFPIAREVRYSKFGMSRPISDLYPVAGAILLASDSKVSITSVEDGENM